MLDVDVLERLLPARVPSKESRLLFLRDLPPELVEAELLPERVPTKELPPQLVEAELLPKRVPAKELPPQLVVECVLLLYPEDVLKKSKLLFPVEFLPPMLVAKREKPLYS